MVEIQVEIRYAHAGQAPLHCPAHPLATGVAWKDLRNKEQLRPVQGADCLAEHIFSGTIAVHLSRIDKRHAGRNTLADPVDFLLAPPTLLAEIPCPLTQSRHNDPICQRYNMLHIHRLLLNQLTLKMVHFVLDSLGCEASKLLALLLEMDILVDNLDSFVPLYRPLARKG